MREAAALLAESMNVRNASPVKAAAILDGETWKSPRQHKKRTVPGKPRAQAHRGILPRFVHKAVHSSWGQLPDASSSAKVFNNSLFSLEIHPAGQIPIKSLEATPTAARSALPPRYAQLAPQFR